MRLSQLLQQIQRRMRLFLLCLLLMVQAASITAQADDGPNYGRTIGLNGSLELLEQGSPVERNFIDGPAILYQINVGGEPSVPGWANDRALIRAGFLETLNITCCNENSTGVPQELFQSERFDPDRAGPNIMYDFPVPVGEYEVRLYFAETFGAIRETGRRVFDVVIEGFIVDRNLDLFAAGGGLRKPFVRSTVLYVTDGTLRIELLHRGRQNPTLNAIQIIRLGPIRGGAMVAEGTPNTYFVQDQRLNREPENVLTPVAVYKDPLLVYAFDTTGRRSRLILALNDNLIAAAGIPTGSRLSIRELGFLVSRAFDHASGETVEIRRLASGEINIHHPAPLRSGPPGSRVLIAATTNPYTRQPIRLYRLATGEFQIMTFYRDDTPYNFTWSP